MNPPTASEIDGLADGATIVAMLSPSLNPELVGVLATRGITAIALDAVPRISRAQSMDVLSSMANIAGYRAVIEAANEFGRFFTGQVTAAGKVPPAKVLVAGAGVAGLAAIGAASSLGAIVRATDPRPEVADQVASIGGQYLDVVVPEEAKQVSADGYAKATSEAYNRRAAEIYSEQAADVDIIITTALIPGRAAPRLITAADVASMRPGSVIVDMAAAQGGNVEGSVAGQRVVTENGVVILGLHGPAGTAAAAGVAAVRDQPGEPAEAADPGQGRGADARLRRCGAADGDGRAGRCGDVAAAARGGVGGAAGCVSGRLGGARRVRRICRCREEAAVAGAGGLVLAGVGVAVLFLVCVFAPPPLPQHFLVLTLAVVVGFYVIGQVAHALHTPLMSVTNAISGIIIVGAMVQLTVPDLTVQIVAAVAVLLASINIVGGFAVTRRMLAMFQKGESR